MKSNFGRVVLSLGLVGQMSFSLPSLASTEHPKALLEESFRNPPSDAKSWVLWHWLRTPTTPEAMTRDLEEIKAKGFEGFALHDTGAGTGLPLPLRLPWSPEFRKEMRYVAREAKRLGLKFVLGAAPSGMTAPGLDPQYSDQELKWTAQEVSGPMKFEGVLALPETTKAENMKEALNKDGSPMFRDIRVLAVPVKKPIELAEIQDLSSKMDGTGKLSWEVPAGKWRILRFIQRPKNVIERWGEKYATYCDVLSPEGIEQAWALTMAPLLKEMTPEERSGLAGVEDDSYEGGHGDWTRILPQEFQKRRGYDLLKYLPVLAGETIGDEATTTAVKRDYKQTKMEMVAENYFGRFRQLCHQNGLELYAQSTNYPQYGWNGHQFFTPYVDHSTAEFWQEDKKQFNRATATANHIFGRKITASESFTAIGPYFEETPFFLKGLVDRAYCEGMNRVWIHSYSHSPLLDAKPGYVFMAGTIINRNITWWEESPAFFNYMERCQALLQAGDFAADMLWLIGDGLAGDWETKGAMLELKRAYDYDRISNDNLIELASFKDGRIVLPSGMKYRVLYMPPFHQRMALPALKKIAELADAGATIIGPRPMGISGLQFSQEDEKEFAELKAKLWGNLPDPQAGSDIKVGRGRVINGKLPWQVLQEMGFGPDFEYEGLSEKGEVNWIHRQSADADWYFVSSRGVSPEKLTCKFRITGKQPELWDAVSGEMRDATAFRQENGQTIVPLEFDPSSSVFIVFRKSIAPNAAGTTASNYSTTQELGQLDGAWSVAFDPKWGGPAEPVTFASLVDWTSRPEDGIKYYSGSAIYTKTFDVPGVLPAGQRVMLDLGEVREVASVKLNGKELGVVWTQPARVDITGVVKPTGNQLELKVVNLWPNRLIGDDALPLEKQYTKFNMRNYFGSRRFTKGSPLRPSGLLGPVRLMVLVEEKLTQLSKEFVNPPDAARPQVYWFWLGGQVTREGLTADLEAMHHAGVGGTLIMTQGGSMGDVPMRSIDPDFLDMVEHAARESERLGIELALHNCSGWAGSGGPWIKPEQSMQEVTYSEIQITGGKTIVEKLPNPPSKEGFYRDIAVLAFPTPGDERDVVTPDNPVTITTNARDIDVSGLAEGLPGAKIITFPWKAVGPFYVQADFAKPTTVRAIKIKSGSSLATGGHVMGSDDGVNFKPLIRFELKPVDVSGYAQIIFQTPVTAKAFRFPFDWSWEDRNVTIGHIQFLKRIFNPDLTYKAVYDQPHHATPDVALMMEKGKTREVEPDAIINKESLVDLTSRMRVDGVLEWDAPAGDWTIIRFGHASNGRKNSGPWWGLECDKLDPDGIKAAWSGLMEPVIKRLGPLAGKTLLGSEIDSWEVGGQNWTAKTELMRNEFMKRRGYDPVPYLPVLTGRCLGSTEITERFLWDLRRTISELIRENYYRPFTKLCNEAGLKSMCEPYVGPYESMECGSEVNIPMGEFWPGRDVLVKIASSIGNGYGRKIVAAEAFTGVPIRHGGWQDDPFSLKTLGDQMTCWGINRFIIHRMVHQPWLNRAPGLGLSTYGINFDRTNTWFDWSGGWLKYIARCHYLLRQGRTVADVAFFCGQNSPVIDRYGSRKFDEQMDTNKEPQLPKGYYWDSINTDLLMNHAKVENGRLVLESGASYAVLVLAFDDPLMTPELLGKIKEFVKDGLTVLGPPPASSPSLQNYPACDQEIKKLVQDLWGDLKGRTESDNTVGKGRIVHGKKLATVLTDLKLPPDLEAPSQTEYIHRDVGGGVHIYFVSNQKNEPVSGDYVFRQSGKIPEVWHPDTGIMEQVSAYKEEGGRTRIPLDLEARGSVMVVFREASTKSVAVAPASCRKAADAVVLSGAWTLRFPAGLGAPAEVTLDGLRSWTEHEQPGVKYFSGTATYLKEIDIPAASLEKGKIVRLDLGEVKNLAKVTVNGVDLGVLWKPPFQVDISSAAKPGKNQLEIQVVNLWVNRLIGDEQLPEDPGFTFSKWNPRDGSVMHFTPNPPQWFKDGKPSPSGRITFSINHPYNKDSVLFPSGLLGPVRIIHMNMTKEGEHDETN